MSDGIGGYVRADEKLLWTGKPQQGLRFTGRDVFMIPFSLMWMGFVVVWLFGATSAGAPGFFVVWGGLFFLIGSYFTVGRFVHDAWLRSQTAYALTDRRVLILRNGPGSSFTAVDLGRLDQVRFKPEGQRGTISFGPEPSMFAGRGANLGIWVESLSGVPGFAGIDNARWVFDQIESRRIAG